MSYDINEDGFDPESLLHINSAGKIIPMGNRR